MDGQRFSCLLSFSLAGPPDRGFSVSSFFPNTFVFRTLLPLHRCNGWESSLFQCPFVFSNISLAFQGRNAPILRVRYSCLAKPSFRNLPACSFPKPHDPFPPPELSVIETLGFSDSPPTPFSQDNLTVSSIPPSIETNW